MCDTLYKKIGRGLIFGKNSDRSPNEPNLTIYYPPKKTSEKQVQCTYISIDEVSSTNGLLLIQPSWMWGGEMGINDKGVIIGNEAVFTRSRGKKENKLIGMDLLRLGLERGSTAKECLDIIISLVEKHGQGGNCGFDKPFYYDNSFLIADKDKAYVLETTSKDWVTYEIDDNYNISNRLSLNDNYTNSSNQKKNFAKRNSEFLFTHFSGSLTRQKEASEYLNSKNFNISKMIESLRHHHLKDQSHLYTKGSIKSVCMHKSTLGDHTTSSMIVSTHKNINTIWLTGCSTPCLSIYKPTFFSFTIAPVFETKPESLDYWLEREYLVRAIYGGLIDEQDYKVKLNTLQNQFIKEEEDLFKTTPTKEELYAFSSRCSNLEQEFVDSYRFEIDQIKVNQDGLSKIWQKQTKHLGENVFESDLEKRINYK